tara:strand:- start:319 stop:780 length:462 start_codon:yes stop_codon:yes gene_type:complete
VAREYRFLTNVNFMNKIPITILTFSFLAVIWISWITFNPDQAKSGLVRFVTISELEDVNEDERIRLGGLVKPGSINISPNNQMDCNFSLQQGEHNVDVFFSGIRPDMFKDEAEVIVEGNYLGGKFSADQLQTKCASRYEGDLKDQSAYKYENI